VLARGAGSGGGKGAGSGAGSGGGKGASPQAHSRALCSGAREVHRCEDVKLINVIIVSLAV
jgi:hypothetical protein